MTVNGAYTAVNHKVTVVNGPYFTRLASTVLRPFVDVSYTIKNGEKRAENRISKNGEIRLKAAVYGRAFLT
jgi:type V secretory pathway adhesin AidA